jgi:hypothetical protein
VLPVAAPTLPVEAVEPLVEVALFAVLPLVALAEPDVDAPPSEFPRFDCWVPQLATRHAVIIAVRTGFDEDIDPRMSHLPVMRRVLSAYVQSHSEATTTHA